MSANNKPLNEPINEELDYVELGDDTGAVALEYGMIGALAAALVGVVYKLFTSSFFQELLYALIRLLFEFIRQVFM